MAQYRDVRYYYQPHDHHQGRPYVQADEHGNPIAQPATPESILHPPSAPHQTAIAAQQQNELFIGAQPPAPPPRNNSTAYSPPHAPRYSYPQSPQQPAYNPQAYGRPLSVVPAHAFPGAQQPPSASSAHAPYNPADYHREDMQRMSSQRSSYSPGSYSSPVYSPPSQHPPVFQSPPLTQQPYAPSRASLYGPPRPTLQTSSYSDHSTPPPPPRPSQYSSNVPPLSTIPQSATEPEEGWNHIPSQPPPPSQPQLPQDAYQRSSPNNSSTHPSYPSPPAHHPGNLSQVPRHSSNGNAEPAAPPYSPYSQYSHPLPPTPAPPPPPPHSPPGNNSQSHPRPDDYFYSHTAQSDSQLTADELLEQVMNLGGSHSSRVEVNQNHDSLALRPNGSLPNGHLTPDPAYEEYMNESDLEAEAGVEAMRVAEEEEAAALRRESSGSGTYSSYIPRQHSRDDDGESGESDGPPVDFSVLGGPGFNPHMSYGGSPAALTVERNRSLSSVDNRSYPASSTGSMRRSNASDAEGYDFDPSFPPIRFNARVDTGGTGGLEDPSQHMRRLSYDEGDEMGFFDDQGGLRDMYFHPGMTNRPLPPPPPGESPSYPSATGAPPYPNEWSNETQMPYPRMPQYPQEYMPASASSPLVPRSTSLVNHTTTRQELPLPRSRTDAEERERKWKQQQMRRSGYIGGDSETTSASADNVTVDLPSIPAAKRYNPAKLGTNDFKKCSEPWAVSSTVAWLKGMAEGEQDLRPSMLVEGLVALFTNKVPTMNIADAETLAENLVRRMRDSGVLVQEEEWLKFSGQTMTGVIYQLTGVGCYSPKLHDYNMPGRCYSHHCQRTLKKLDLSSPIASKGSEDWAKFYELKPLDLEGHDRKEIDRQNTLHEIVWKEEKFMEDLDVLRHVYRDALLVADPPLITPARLPGFIKDVFSRADAIKKANEDYLLPQLKYRQREQGPWIAGFSDIFREWIRKARAAYVAYAGAFPHANYRIRKEAERNHMFSKWLEDSRKLPQSRKLGWDTYLKVPITKLQQYGLLLDTVLRRTVVDSDEKRMLQTALEEIRAVTHECDNRVAEMKRKVDLKDLQTKLKLRPGMERVELNLDHLGRELIHKGELQRLGGRKLNWMEADVLLFDHYLVMAKKGFERDPREGNVMREVFDVSRLPIPMDLLVLESRDDEPVVKSMKGLTTVTVVSKAGVGAGDSSTRLTRGGPPSQTGPPTPGPLPHSNTSTSLASLASTNSSKTTVTTTVIDPQGGAKEDNALWPFRVKHLGKETYTLFAPNRAERETWCDRIIEAKTRHAAALFAQNAEPFRVRVLADTAFAYESGSGPAPSSRSTLIKGTPLDRAIKEVEERYLTTGRPNPVCRAKVNCATNFRQGDSREMCAIGTDFGVFVSAVDDPRGWIRVIPSLKVTQVAVLEDFSLFLLIADKSLIAYHLDVVISGLTGGGGGPSNSVRGAPQKLSGSRDVGFFATGRMKDRQLLMYKKKEGLSSTFKVLEPVFQKSTEKRSRFPPLRSGRTEFFREFDEFYIPTDCMGLNLFHTSLAVSTLKGFEVLRLDKKQSFSIPDLKPAEVAEIAARLTNQTPLGMFRLGDQDFLCVYEECAVYVNKHGDISRSVVMEFVGRARAAALYGAYVLLFDAEMVEIRNAQNGRLRQVISGRDVRCIDDGQNGGSFMDGGGSGSGSGNANGAGRRIKLAMQHPRAERSQLVVELVLNEGLKE